MKSNRPMQYASGRVQLELPVSLLRVTLCVFILRFSTLCPCDRVCQAIRMISLLGCNACGGLLYRHAFHTQAGPECMAKKEHIVAYTKSK